MTKLKKSTTARIEDALDIVADKIIDLENTVKQIEIIEKRITQTVSKAESISIQIDTQKYNEVHDKFTAEQEVAFNNLFNSLKNASKLNRPIYLFVVMLILLLGILFCLNNSNQSKIRRLKVENMQIRNEFISFIKENKLDEFYKYWDEK